MQKRLFTASVLAAIAAPVFAQAPQAETPSTLEAGVANGPLVLEASAAWNATHGAEWRTVQDSQTGFVRFLYGGHTESVGASVSDADLVDLALVHLGEAYGMFGIDPNGLVLDGVTFLPLGMVGTTDKTTVQFRQVLDGVSVERGLVTALFDQSGRLLSLDTVGLPDVLLPTATRPTRDIENAEALAIQTFSEATGLPALDIEVLGLEIVQEELGKLRQGTLAWRIRVGNQVQGTEPQAFIYAISATGARRVVKSDNQIHYFDVGGNAQVLATPGIGPDTAGNPPVLFPAGYMRVTSPQAGTTFTDAFGNFNFVGASGPINATFEFVGTYNNVNNQAGGDYSLSTSLADGTTNSVLLNGSPSEQVTAQANCHVSINFMRDWTRSVNPADASADFVATSNPNISSTCNAYYNGSSTNYYLAGGGCNNTAFANVIYHEMGHWMNDKYSSGNGSDGFGEGNADVFAMYQSDSPIVGADFFGPGTDIRNGENTKQFCGDSNPGCYGQVHADGEVLMGALWKVRKRLNASLGDAQGDALSDLLFNSWMNAYNDGQIKTIIETHWLTLDDDDGNIGNGTPHYTDIDAGFTDQGFPGFQLIFVNITDVAGPSDTFDESGPYGVSAKITPNFGTSITSANLFYRVNGGIPFSVPMSSASGDRFFATIPGQASPNKVEWWIAATNDLGQTNLFPADAPAKTNDFTVGDIQVFFFDDFETTGDNGWVHAQIATQDDWMRGTPNGAAGDATSAFSGTRVWGNDLAPSGYNGSYQPNVENYLRSPLIDLSGSAGAKLIYQRWLTVEEAIFDQATILVNGNQVWQNPLSGNLIDTSWNTHEVDISSFDGQNIQLEWHLKSDGGLEFGGWNLDDVAIQTLKASPTVGLPVYFGSATGGSTVPTIDTAGQPATLGNNAFRATVKNTPSETTVFLGFGFGQLTLPLLGVTQLILPTNVFSGQADLFGQYSVPIAVPASPGFVGLTAYFQALVVDAGGPAGFTATNGMQITIVP